MKKALKTWSLRIVILTLGCLLSQTGFSSESFNDNCSTSKNKIQLNSHEKTWRPGTRSNPSPDIPSVFIDGTSLIISNDNSDCDLFIKITNNSGEIAIQQQVPAAETLYILISLNDLPNGEYTLELRNNFGGYLYGDFTKE